MNTYSSMDEQERGIIRSHLRSSFPIVQAVIDGAQQGEIFRSARKDYWVLHKTGFSEVFLNADNGIELVDFISENHDLPKYFHIYNPPEKLTSLLKLNTEAFNIRDRDRIQLTYKAKLAERNSRNLSKEEFTTTEVTQDNFDSLDVFNLDLANKFWNGKEEFVQKGLGVFLKDKMGNPVTLCYAAAFADQKAEIDVVTSEHYRGKGLAKSVVNSFISKCINSNTFPNWDCFSDNRPSLALAISLGFTEKRFYSLISVYRK